MSHLQLYHFDFHGRYTSCKTCKHKLVKKNTALGLVHHMKSHLLQKNQSARPEDRCYIRGPKVGKKKTKREKFSKCILCKDLTFFVRKVNRSM